MSGARLPLPRCGRIDRSGPRVDADRIGRVRRSATGGNCRHGAEAYGEHPERTDRKKESERNNEEELSAYFQNKYFKNKDYFKKKTSGDNPFDLTRKLYNQNIDQKVKMQEDYVMFHEFTYKAYYEHKDDVKFGEDRHIVFKLIYDFRYLILTSILGATVYGIYSGFSRDDKDKEDTGNIKYFNDGKGLLTKALPINVV